MNADNQVIPVVEDDQGEGFKDLIETEDDAPVKRRQFHPGQQLTDSRGQAYFVDKNCSVRRADGGKLNKAERKAAKRARRRP